ncbi:MAG: hypothetical protein NC548_30775 [Lachnospiraceae bacterium]|nr:hypothetical protein [Lachnospiraceae bacterium]
MGITVAIHAVEVLVVSVLAGTVRVLVREVLRLRRLRDRKLGLFGGLFKAQDKHVSFLDKADDAYTRALQTKNAAGLDAYFTRACLSRMLERIRMSEKAYSGLDRYKHVEWKKLDDDGQVSHYVKTVTYDNVQISKGISAAVGQSYTERWTLVTEKGGTKISEIRRSA